MGYRYANRSGKTIFLNNKRGSRQTFKPDEWTTDPWFSRFVGKNMLSKETADGNPVHATIPGPIPVSARTNRKVRDSTIQIPPARIIEPHTPHSRVTPSELLQQGCQVTCEQSAQSTAKTPHWVQIGAIFYCNYCDYFSLGDVAALRQHIAVYHGIPIDQQEEQVVASTSTPSPPEVVESQVEAGITATPTPVELPPLPPEAPPLVEQDLTQAIANSPLIGESVNEALLVAALEPPPAIPDAAAGPFVCETCGKTFGGSHGLKIHKGKYKHV